jgi:two-component system KDP operon response regulator KdpE
MLQRQVLLVTEDVELSSTLQVEMKRLRAALSERRCLNEAASLAAKRGFDLVIADARLSNAIDAACLLRPQTQAPLVVLATPTQVASERAVFEAGADDFLTLPFERPALLGKLSILKHARPPVGEDSRLNASAQLELDDVAHELRFEGRTVHLTPAERKLLGVLLASAGRFVSHRRLLLELWGSSSLHRLEQLQVKMRQLQRKLGLLSLRDLVVVPAFGYSLRLPA